MTTVTKKGGVRHYTGSLANCRLLPQRVLAFVTDTLKELFINVAGVDYHFYANVGGARHIESFRASGYTDTQVLQAAASSGSQVWFPAGTWASTSQLVLASGTQFVGSGASSILSFANGVLNPILLSGVTNCKLKDLSIVSSSSGLSDYTSGVVTFTNGTSHVVIDNCDFTSTKVTDLYFSGSGASASHDIRVTNCRLTHPDKLDGRQFACFMTGRSLTRNWFTADGVEDTFTSTFTMASTSELSVYFAGKLQVAGTDYTVTLASGFATVVFAAPPTESLSGATVSLVLNSGPMFQTIDTVGHSNIKFIGCTFTDCASGFLIDGDNFEIRNCEFDTTSSPIAVSFSKNLTIRDNRIIDFTGNGLTIGNGGDDIIENYVVAGNILTSTVSTLHGINIYKAGGNSQGFGGPNYGRTRKGVISGNTVSAALSSVFLYGNGDCVVSGNVCTSSIGVMANTHDKDGGATHPGKIVVSGNVIRVTSVGVSVGASGIASASDAQIVANDISSPDGTDVLSYGVQLSRADGVRVMGNSIRNIKAYNVSDYTGAGVGLNLCGDGVVLDGNRVVGVSGHASVWLQSSTAKPSIFRDNEWNGTYKKLGAGSDPISSGNLNTSTLKHNGCNSTPLSGATSAGLSTTNTATTDWTGGQTSSENRSGVFLVSFGSSRAASSNYATDHAHCVALMLCGRATTGVWSIVATTYLEQHNGATVTMTNVGDVLTFSGTSGATSANRSIITVQSLSNPLICDISGQVL